MIPLNPEWDRHVLEVLASGELDRSTPGRPSGSWSRAATLPTRSELGSPATAPLERRGRFRLVLVLRDHSDLGRRFRRDNRSDQSRHEVSVQGAAGAATSGELVVDVLVVGSGPTGATAALALATYGVRVHVVSKWNWLADTPRAHITNQRAVEVLRDLGVEEEANTYATPWDQMGDTLFTTSLAGEEIARSATWGTGDQRLGTTCGQPVPDAGHPAALLEPLW